MASQSSQEVSMKFSKYVKGGEFADADMSLAEFVYEKNTVKNFNNDNDQIVSWKREFTSLNMLTMKRFFGKWRLALPVMKVLTWSDGVEKEYINGFHSFSDNIPKSLLPIKESFDSSAQFDARDGFKFILNESENHFNLEVYLTDYEMHFYYNDYALT